jgi:3'-5' exoribonuclease
MTDSDLAGYPEALLTKEFFVADLRPRDMVRTTFLVQTKNVLLNKNGRPYLAMTLRDRTGAVDTRVWESAEEIGEAVAEGDIVAVFGKAHQFQNRLQLVVDQLIRVPIDNVCMDDYLPATSSSTEQLYGELLEVFRALDCPWTRQLALSLLEDPEIASRYRICPAAKTIHHAYLGGLLEHSLQVIRLVNAVAPLYPQLNKNLLVFGAAFHDFGKIFELSYDGPFGYTDEGKLVGHIAIGVTLVDRKIQGISGFPKDLEWQLKHLILSHHGKLEYGSPKLPVTLEALMLHSLDDMDSRLQSVQSLIDSEKGEGRWTSLHRAYNQSYYKAAVDLNPARY